jgi:hypothetical protein
VENATYIGCYYDCQSGASGPCGNATTSNRDLPVFYCSNGRTRTLSVIAAPTRPILPVHVIGQVIP